MISDTINVLNLLLELVSEDDAVTWLQHPSENLNNEAPWSIMLKEGGAKAVLTLLSAASRGESHHEPASILAKQNS